MGMREDAIEKLEKAMMLSEAANECGVVLGYGTVEDALALLKAQEPRVIKVGDVRNWVNSDRVTREPIVFEIRGGVCVWIVDDEVRGLPGEADLSSDLYGKTWRCWTSRPTDEQREAIPWESVK